MTATFTETLMDQILESAMIPKVQVERAVGPLLSIFLAPVLSATLRADPALSGELTLLCPEFPLKKDGVNQSTNIDWLLLNPARRQLLFVELKTADTSLDAAQSAIYHAKQAAIRAQGGL